jgi:hypothetical protein
MADQEEQRKFAQEALAVDDQLEAVIVWYQQNGFTKQDFLDSAENIWQLREEE